MGKMDDYIKSNQELWNQFTSIHEKSKFYDLEGFKRGKSTIPSLEIEELGSVSGKSLLHLQCHFGLDTLSWAKIGAKVTGVDISDKSVKLARKLNKELKLAANFICSDIYKLPNILSGQFDIVYTSGGVLCWLSDLKEWAKIISRYLKNGGIFYIRDCHPFAELLNEDLKAANFYFHQDEPVKYSVDGSYADRNVHITACSYEWYHSLSEVINSLVGVGLKIEFLHEFPYLGWARFPKLMEQSADGWYRFKEKNIDIPLMFSLKATKTASLA